MEWNAMSDEHHDPSYDMFFYVGQPFLHDWAAVYRPGTERMLLNTYLPGTGFREEVVAVPPMETLEQFEQEAGRLGALDNTMGAFRGPRAGRVAYSDAGSVLFDQPGVSRMTRVRLGDREPDWNNTPFWSARATFAELAETAFEVRDGHAERRPDARTEFGAWLTEQTGLRNVADYLGLSAPAPEPAPAADAATEVRADTDAAPEPARQARAVPEPATPETAPEPVAPVAATPEPAADPAVSAPDAPVAASLEPAAPASAPPQRPTPEGPRMSPATLRTAPRPDTSANTGARPKLSDRFRAASRAFRSGRS
jgi:hypothetical protein